ncbi:S1C family serine protease [Pseudaquabacterium pictum]|uniref:2-alkenal reductase n=1 Tax=Pseudaquabacterium pictum TaxID=2315236 RepID=A0A480AK37_9BURK|nr:trypsin-like peptidase domain-containing protein [Rubrivivax pictus]GCL61080.1 2-alkenal reductase [Rubrivivax pictus]
MSSPLDPIRRRPLLLALPLLLSTACFESRSQKGEAAPRAVTPRGALAADELANIDVFKRIAPSVVHITTLATERDFFNRAVQQVPRGTGTGFVWDAGGHIVTNFHVIQDGSGARVTLLDQTTWPAKLVGAFPDRDLAVLKIDAPREKLPPIPIGTSRDLQVGQKVYAIGNPFGLDQTLTTGIVSALNREIESFNSRTIRGVVQTDAAINPGNSGGPLLDSAGRLIGVNTQIASPSGASAGIGFAIPVDEVNRVVPRLIRDGRITRPALGISAASEQIHRALRLPDGVALVQVSPNGPAAKAGLQPFSRARDGSIVAGDIIVAINDEPVASLDDMLTLLEKRQPGDQVTLSLSRAGRGRKVPVVLGSSD